MVLFSLTDCDIHLVVKRLVIQGASLFVISHGLHYIHLSVLMNTFNTVGVFHIILYSMCSQQQLPHHLYSQ